MSAAAKWGDMAARPLASFPKFAGGVPLVRYPGIGPKAAGQRTAHPRARRVGDSRVCPGCWSQAAWTPGRESTLRLLVLGSLGVGTARLAPAGDMGWAVLF